MSDGWKRMHKNIKYSDVIDEILFPNTEGNWAYKAILSKVVKAWSVFSASACFFLL